MMTWNVWYGCADGCTWQWMATVCGLAVLAYIGWWAVILWMARAYSKHKEDDEA